MVTSVPDLFTVVMQVPQEGAAVELESVTFGVFEESLGEYGTGGCDYDRVVREVLGPWLLAAQRCIGVNDLFECRGLEVKVLAAHPLWGFVGRRTAIMCYQTLSMQPLRDVNFDLLLPSNIDQEMRGIFMGYFFARPMHVHKRT